MYFALLIPVAMTLICYRIWPHKIVWQELFLPLGASLICIWISYFAMKETNLYDVEYNGELVVEARYYEYWETYVEQTCTRSYECGSSDKPQTCTEQYDCSYCDHNSRRYEVVLRDGTIKGCTEAKYIELLNKWKSKPVFVELNRHINYSGGCGEDGDMYKIRWDGKIATSDAYVWKRSFKNPVKISHSAFKFKDISAEEADSMHLYHYPEYYHEYRQPALLSPFKFPELVNLKFEYLNGYLGPKNKVKVFTLLFIDKPLSISFDQEAYFQGGNQNELIVCIGVDKHLNIQWVRSFSWCDNKRINVDTREDIANLKVFDPDRVLAIYYKNISKFFKYKSFKDFNYLSFEPTTGQIIFVFLMTFIVSLGCCIFIIKNDIDPYDTKNRRGTW